MTDEYLMIFVHTRRVLQPTSLRSPLEEGSPSTSQQDTTAVVPYTPLQIAPLNQQFKKNSNLPQEKNVFMVEESNDWRQSLINYLKEGKLPTNKSLAWEENSTLCFCQ